MKQLNIDEKILPVKAVLSEISKAKDKMLSPAEMLKQAEYDNRKASVAKVYEIYQARLKTADEMDFDDLLCNAVVLFEKCPDILEFYQNQFKYIMVDEYQDTNKVQYKFVSMLAEKYEVDIRRFRSMQELAKKRDSEINESVSALKYAVTFFNKNK